MTRITIENATYEVPGNWNELTQTQLIALIRLCEKETSYVEIQLKFFLHCVYGSVRKDIGAGLFIIKTKQARHALFSEELTSVLSVFDYLFDTDPDTGRYLSPKLVRNHFPSAQCGCTWVHGPNDALDNITYNDFIWLQTWHAQLTDNAEALDELINVIYKTRSGKQEVRTIRKMSPTVKTATLWLYLGTLYFLSERFPHVFSGAGEADGSVFDNQQRIIDSLAEGDVTKKNLVRESLLYDALYSMEMAAIRMEEIEKQYKK